MPCFVCGGLIWVGCGKLIERGVSVRIFDGCWLLAALEGKGTKGRLEKWRGSAVPWDLGVQRSRRGQRGARKIRGVWWRADRLGLSDGACWRVGGFWGDVFVKGNSKKAKGAKNCDENSQYQAVGVWVHGLSDRRSLLTSRRPGDGDRIGGECSMRPKGAKKRETNSRSLMLEVDRLELGL